MSLESAVDLVKSLEACEHVALEKPFSLQSHRSYQESSDEVQDLKQMIADLNRAISNTGLMRDNRRQSKVNNGSLCFNCGLVKLLVRVQAKHQSQTYVEQQTFKQAKTDRNVSVQCEMKVNQSEVCWFVNCVIFNVTAKLLVDSGASISMINTKLPYFKMLH